MGPSLSSRCTTHIANAYHETIYCKTSMDHSTVKLEGITAGANIPIPEVGAIGLNAGVNMQYDLKYAEKNGFTKISPNSYLGFEPRGSSTTVYVTIYSASTVICHCFPIKEDYSVIVKPDGTITRTKYGELWVDTSGKYYPHN